MTCSKQTAMRETRLSSLDLRSMEQEWGEPARDQSVDRHPISIGGRTFDHGVGTHAYSMLEVLLDGNGERFTAWVGVDDEVGTNGSVEFQVEADDAKVWSSGVMRGGHAPKQVDIGLKGVKVLGLVVTDAADGKDHDHADWAEATITMVSGEPRAKPLPPREDADILTPKPAPTPRINGAKVFGVRPGNPFLFTIAATGERPMIFGATGLPKGLSLDKNTGRITGVVASPGDHVVTLSAKNKLGQAKRTLRIVCGDTIGLTPPMGWNSWNCFAAAVTAEKVKAAADALVDSGLINHGWSYINIDDFWQVHRDSADPTLQGPRRDAEGRILPNPRFPDMKSLADYVHSLGLKIGLYSSPGPWTCGGCAGSWKHEDLDARQYGEWEFDYLKHDWCSYGAVVKGDLSLPSLKKPYRVMRDALDKVPRDIIYSLCQYGMGNVAEWGAEVGGNCWRTTGDITDTWQSLSSIGFTQAGIENHAGPGHFNDPDMMIVGKVGWGPDLRTTRLTRNEQYTHVSLWCLLAAPLLIGCDMTQLDEFTLSLLTNDEVLDVNQDPLGRQAARVKQEGLLEVWAKDMEDGCKAVGLFNRGRREAAVTAHWSDLGVSGPRMVRDLWRQQDLGVFDGRFTATVPRHGVVLVKVSPK